jgi:hypothetical protein
MTRSQAILFVTVFLKMPALDMALQQNGGEQLQLPSLALALVCWGSQPTQDTQ